MTLKELNSNYYFHDSLLDKIEVDRVQATVVLTIDFCFWAQEDYKETDPETGIIKLSFSEVEIFPELEGDLDSYSILNTSYTDDGSWMVVALDDETDNCYRISIKANGVSLIASNMT